MLLISVYLLLKIEVVHRCYKGAGLTFATDRPYWCGYLMGDCISIRGARVHNLKNISLDIPKNKLVVITGLSGSGKSSLAFDTIYAEGQRRYAESLSAFARQFMEVQEKPDVDEIKGLSPTVAIDQRAAFQNPRSTVGTVTEIYDALRLLFARVGVPHCTSCGREVQAATAGSVAEEVRATVRQGKQVRILATLHKTSPLSPEILDQYVSRTGFQMFRLDGRYYTREDIGSVPLKNGAPRTLQAVVREVSREASEEIPQAIETAFEFGNGFLTLHEIKGDLEGVRAQGLVCLFCAKALPSLEPRLFSFNSPLGACPKCTGLGITLEVDPDLAVPNAKLTLAQGAVEPWMRITGNQAWYQKLLKAVADKHGFSLDAPFASLPKKFRELVLYGTGEMGYLVEGKIVTFPGVVGDLSRRHAETASDYLRKEIEAYMREKICALCAGKRLKPEALAVTVAGKSIAQISAMSTEELFAMFRNPKFLPAGQAGEIRNSKSEITGPIAKEIVRRHEALVKVGLDYVTLDRSMTTLAGGEAQRVRLATQLTTGLTGVIYILDEPSIGLHPRDTERLIATLRTLRDAGNSVLVVEHDSALISAADFVVDVGPGAGRYGGEIIATGAPKEISANKNSLTGKYLSGRERIIPSKTLHKGSGKSLTVSAATAFNLKNLTVKFPLGKLVCVTGVSGSGKSTLVIDILGKALARRFYRAKDEPAAHKAIKGVEHIDKVITVDQTPIGRTPRSNPATYTSVFTLIRDLYTEIPEARMRGYDAGMFSFNVKGGGRCEACAGEGYVRIPMQFLANVYVECAECKGARYNADALEIHFKGKTIADVLAMTVEEARVFFEGLLPITDKLEVLREVGLGYLKLGQPATTLSGGEAQRVKLSTELSRRATGRTLYILDEPTTGLHFADINRLLGVLSALVDKGNTVVIIEHNLEVIKCADWVIDLGPEGGTGGGALVAQGTPKDIGKIKKSHTGQYLSRVLA